MKKSYCLLLTLTIIVGFSSCIEYSSHSAVSNDDTASTEITQKEVTKKIDLPATALAFTNDLVCDMSVTKSIEDTTIFEGKVYAFCSTECKDEFLKNPKEYINKAAK